MTAPKAAQNLLSLFFVDIRGFSNFSAGHDSIESAIFVRRFFQLVIDNYFPFSHYVKPTGDGLLLVTNYTERDLKEVANKVIEASVKLERDFGQLFMNEEMVNFQVPEKIGIGISRGTVCCLYSGKEIVDYSGKVLNLAARLMEMARPSGLVIDGLFQIRLVSDELQSAFDTTNVYIRGIHEDVATPIYYLKGTTEINDSYRTPPNEEILLEATADILVSKLRLLSGNYFVVLEKEPDKNKPIKAGLIFPHPKAEGLERHVKLSEVTIEREARSVHAIVVVKEVLGKMDADGVGDDVMIKIRVQYYPKKR